MKHGTSDEQEMNSNFIMTPAVMNNIISENQIGKEDTIVDCEPSLEIDEPSQEDNSLRFQQKTKTLIGETLNEIGRDTPKRSENVSVDDLNDRSKPDRKIHSDGGLTPVSLLNVEKFQAIFHKEKTQPDTKANTMNSIVKIRSHSPNPRLNTGILLDEIL